MTITVTAGHSVRDPGACAHGRREADIAVDAREIIKYYLVQWGHKVVSDGLDRTQNLELPEAIKLQKGSDISVEVHCNAGAETANGVEVLAKNKDAALAKAIAGAIHDTMGIKLRRNEGWYADANEHHRFGFVRAGGLIIELFFITNKAEIAIWDAKKWVICKAIAKAISDHLK